MHLIDLVNYVKDTGGMIGGSIEINTSLDFFVIITWWVKHFSQCS